MKIIFRNDTESNWKEVDPVLGNREPGIVKDDTTGKPIHCIIGDGVTKASLLKKHPIWAIGLFITNGFIQIIEE